ncbi:uncharacterized protein FN964_001933 isoform 5-T6 [Alca torda]
MTPYSAERCYVLPGNAPPPARAGASLSPPPTRGGGRRGDTRRCGTGQAKKSSSGPEGLSCIQFCGLEAPAFLHQQARTSPYHLAGRGDHGSHAEEGSTLSC